MRNRSASSTEPRTAGGGRRSSSSRYDNVRQDLPYRGGSRQSDRRMMEDERERMRKRARKKKRRRQRRMVLGTLFLLMILLIGGVAYGFWKHRRETKKQELLKEGIEKLEQGSYEEAVARLDEALRWSKGKVGEFETTVLLYRAEAEFRLEDYGAAQNTYQILCDTDTENMEYKKGVAYCMVKKGEYDEALALGVIDGYICNLKAVEQMNAGEYDVALEWIERGKAAGDSLQDLMLNEAVAWENKGDFARALELFEAYASQYGTDENVEHELTFLRSRQGNRPEAEVSDSSDTTDGTSQEMSGAQGESGEDTSAGEEGNVDSQTSETSGSAETESSREAAAVG